VSDTTFLWANLWRKLCEDKRESKCYSEKSVREKTKFVLTFVYSILQIFILSMANIIKSSIFCDITLCSPLKVNWRFGGTCFLHLQGLKISQERNVKQVWISARLCVKQVDSKVEHSFLPAWRYFPPKPRLFFNGLHSIISQNTELFITTAVRTSNTSWRTLYIFIIAITNIKYVKHYIHDAYFKLPVYVNKQCTEGQVLMATQSLWLLVIYSPVNS
jgi:hypothetical protein